MKVTFVGHASVIAEIADVSIWSDPWLQGDAFNDSWALYPRPVVRDQDLARVTHIWISHEHPDHLSIPTITKALSSDQKARITVLFQRHYDAEVVSWLRKQGFKEVLELPHGEWVRLSPGCMVACYQVGHIDSALAIKASGETVLNINDCDVPDATLRRISRELGHVDLLLNQFSIAGWCGNAEDLARRREAAHGSLSKFAHYAQCLNPDYILPFASFIRFSHAENAYMNSAVNSLDEVVARVGKRQLLIMYPGDVWDSANGPFAGIEEALSRYRSDRSEVAAQPLRSHEPVPMEKIIEAANQRIADMQQNYHRTVLRWVPPVSFYVTDLGRSFVVDLRKGAHEVQLMNEANCTVSLGSQAAWHAFAMRFGLPTLGVSGRFRINHSEANFARLKKLCSAYSSGLYTRKAPRFGIGWRLFEFWWRRRRDIVPQYIKRLPFFEEGRAQSFDQSQT
jgi:UDP-MurNAc hydroxylase